jgi:hypothetical protein
MAPKSSTAPDQFEVLGELVRRGRRAWLLNLVFGVVALLSLLVAFLSFSRPLPVVFRPDSPDQKAQLVVASSDQKIREIDAKRFFVNMTELVHGWDSSTVLQQMQKATLLMTTAQRLRLVAEMNSVAEVPKEINPEGRGTRIDSFIGAKIRNEVEIDWDSLRCTEAPGAWHCKAKVTINTQPLLGLPIDNPKLKRTLSIKASFKPVPVTVNTLDGLLADFWDAKEPE